MKCLSIFEHIDTNPMRVFETERLVCRQFSTADARFMLSLLNDAGWLRYIGDRGVRTEEQATEYLLLGAIRNYELLGYGFYLVELKYSQQAIGMCGFAKRDYLEVADLGFALLQKYEGAGYAFEAASACLTYAKESLQLPRIQATTRSDNQRSSTLLEKLGMRFKNDILHPDGDRYLKLYEMYL